MEHVQLEDVPADERAVIHAVDVADYTEQAFKMYNGKIESITVSFSRDLIGVIYDKFGEDTEIWQEDGRYAANVKVQISPTFWAGYSSLGGGCAFKGLRSCRKKWGGS